MCRPAATARCDDKSPSFQQGLLTCSAVQCTVARFKADKFSTQSEEVYTEKERKWLQFLNKQMDVYFHTWLDVCPNLRSAPLKLQWICHEGQHIWLLYVSWICRKQKGERGRCKIPFRRRAKQVENAKKSAQQQQHNNNKQAKLLCAGRRPRHLFYFLPLKKKTGGNEPPPKKNEKVHSKKAEKN